nr:type VI secretion system baseplate subunit TssF [Methylobacterium sp. OTU13CASTA1]
MNDRLYGFYNSELEALRGLGGRFAERHPKIAGRLRLSPDAIDDPHVARLIESFAFIAARLRLKLDDDFPELTETLLEFLYPHYLAPIPALAVTQVAFPPDLKEVITLPRGAVVESEVLEGDVCRFRTTQDVELWPVRVASVALTGRPLVAPPCPHVEAPASLRIVLETVDPGVTFTDLGVDRLRFYLRAPWQPAVALYELLLNDCLEIALADHAEDGGAVFIGPDAIRAVGFEPAEAVLPPAPRSHPAYRLLTEFFAYPQKFLFLDLSRLSAKTLRRAGNRLEIFFYLGRHPQELERACTAGTFALACTPVVNLFEQRAEPIMLTQVASEYALVPDARRHASREVYAVERVTLTDRAGMTRDASPLFGRTLAQHDAVGALYWQLRRRHLAEGGEGTDARLALVDAAASPASPTDAVLSVDTTCINRDLPARLPYGGEHPVLTVLRGPGEVGRLKALTPFTATLRLTPGDGLLWRLISHLTLNHLSLSNGEGGPEALREILRLYDFRDAPETRTLIDGIVSVTHRRATARVAEGGLARGLDIEVEMDRRYIDPGAAFLLGQVLDRFFGLYVNLNSFTRLTVRMRGAARALKTWPARSGARPLV